MISWEARFFYELADLLGKFDVRITGLRDSFGRVINIEAPGFKESVKWRSSTPAGMANYLRTVTSLARDPAANKNLRLQIPFMAAFNKITQAFAVEMYPHHSPDPKQIIIGLSIDADRLEYSATCYWEQLVWDAAACKTLADVLVEAYHKQLKKKYFEPPRVVYRANLPDQNAEQYTTVTSQDLPTAVPTIGTDNYGHWTVIWGG